MGCQIQVADQLFNLIFIGDLFVNMLTGFMRARLPAAAPRSATADRPRPVRRG